MKNLFNSKKEFKLYCVFEDKYKYEKQKLPDNSYETTEEECELTLSYQIDCFEAAKNYIDCMKMFWEEEISDEEVDKLVKSGFIRNNQKRDGSVYSKVYHGKIPPGYCETVRIYYVKEISFKI